MERPSTLKLREKDVTRQITDFLRAEGWTLHRLHTGTARLGKSDSHIQLNPKGTPDWLAIRATGQRQNFYAEIKAPGKKLSYDQQLCCMDLTQAGFLVFLIDNFENFRARYEECLR